MNRIIILSILIYVLVAPTLKSQDHLEPEDSPFLPWNNSKELSLFTIPFFKEFRPIPLLQTTCFPSFKPVWTVGVIEFPDSAFKLVAAKSNKPFTTIMLDLHQKKRTFLSKNTIKYWEKDISSLEVIALIHIYFKMVSESRYDSVGRVGLDGETYHFFALDRNIGSRAGRTWSPDSSSIAWLLTKLSFALFEYASADKTEEAASLSCLRNKISEFPIKH
jgi:hypothetical protein